MLSLKVLSARPDELIRPVAPSYAGSYGRTRAPPSDKPSELRASAPMRVADHGRMSAQCHNATNEVQIAYIVQKINGVLWTVLTLLTFK